MKVAVINTEKSYPGEFPYHPGKAYPEYRGEVSGEPNYVYDAVRRMFLMLGYDRENLETERWNPLGFLIKPGDRVFIKPNFVAHRYRASCPGEGNLFSVITHPSVIRAVADYTAIALKGKGEIIIGDTPSIDADFAKLCSATGVDRFERLYREKYGIECRVMDLRSQWCDNLKYYGFKDKMRSLPGDPEGSTQIDLADKSAFHGIDSRLFRGIYTNRKDTIKHHSKGRHEYVVSNSVLNSDVFISLPKLKAHRKVGATLNIKGLVGTVTEKNCLIHWRIGYPEMGGDEYPSPENKKDISRLRLMHIFNDLFPEKIYFGIARIFKNTSLGGIFQTERSPSGMKHRGAWQGNDSCWRMAADLYNVFVRDVTGLINKRKGKPMKFYSVVDGILAGEGNGPFCTEEKKVNVLVGGEDLLSVDAVCARLMDFRIENIKYLDWLLGDRGHGPDTIEILSEHYDTDEFFNKNKKYLGFKAPDRWPDLSMLSDASNSGRR
ncbi:MAG: DUF362 domain-containing protein [Elusimicrobia bacterium]|nr:DUF362 domain-containing protein [Elusimicrobiota bacterium]